MPLLQRPLAAMPSYHENRNVPVDNDRSDGASSCPTMLTIDRMRVPKMTVDTRKDSSMSQSTSTTMASLSSSSTDASHSSPVESRMPVIKQSSSASIDSAQSRNAANEGRRTTHIESGNRSGPGTSPTQREKVMHLIDTEDWEALHAYLFPTGSETDRIYKLSRQPFRLVCKGENCVVSLAHFISVKALQSQNRPKVSLIDKVLKSNLTALKFPDSRGGRLPLHMVCVFLKDDTGSSGSTAFARDLVALLVSAYPKALKVADNEGNLPLHHAYMNSLPIARLLLAKYPAACAVANHHERLPLHILCSRVCIDDAVSVEEDLRVCIEAYSVALSTPDRFGRLPLHIACQTNHLSWDMLQCLFEAYPAALLHEDKSFQTPLSLALSLRKRYDGDAKHDVVLAGLEERTEAEARRTSSSGFFRTRWAASSRRARFRRQRKAGVDLMNCYG